MFCHFNGNQRNMTDSQFVWCFCYCISSKVHAAINVIADSVYLYGWTGVCMCVCVNVYRYMVVSRVHTDYTQNWTFDSFLIGIVFAFHLGSHLHTTFYTIRQDLNIISIIFQNYPQYYVCWFRQLFFVEFWVQFLRKFIVYFLIWLEFLFEDTCAEIIVWNAQLNCNFPWTDLE